MHINFIISEFLVCPSCTIENSDFNRAIRKAYYRLVLLTNYGLDNLSENLLNIYNNKEITLEKDDSTIFDAYLLHVSCKIDSAEELLFWSNKERKQKVSGLVIHYEFDLIDRNEYIAGNKFKAAKQSFERRIIKHKD